MAAAPMDNALTVLLAWAVRHSSGFNVLDFGKGADGDRKRNQWMDALNGAEVDGKRVRYPKASMKNLHGLLKRLLTEALEHFLDSLKLHKDALQCAGCSGSHVPRGPEELEWGPPIHEKRNHANDLSKS